MGGFFGTISVSDCVNDLFYGTDYNSHLGTRRAGMATFDPEKGFSRSIHSLERDYFRSKFEDELDEFHGCQGIGVISDTDPQPIIINSHLGRFAVVTVAKINNMPEIAHQLLAERMHFSEMSANKINQTELVALLINMGSSFVDGINKVFDKIEGSCSMLILTEDGIIAARDKCGRTPIVIGKKEGAYAATSESTSFPNLDYAIVHDLGPGEIVKLQSNGLEVLQKPCGQEQMCSFLWVYYGFPTSDYNGVNVEEMRERNGFIMGREDDTEADIVCGIPDSGVGMAIGYSEGHGIPYKRAVLKYTPTWPRSFTPGNQSRRNLVAKMKLIPNRAILTGQRVVFPLVYGCPFVNFTSSKSDLELITRRVIQDFEGDPEKNLEKYSDVNSPEYHRMVDEIAHRLGITSLRFNKIDNLVKAIGLPKERICTHCFDGSGCKGCPSKSKK